MRIEAEPEPRELPDRWTPPLIDVSVMTLLTRRIRSPSTPFLDVLNARTSAAGGRLDDDDLSSLLWHSTLLRRRVGAGRSGLRWESRSAPSAGGLHPTRLMVLPVDRRGATGLYCPEAHGVSELRPSASEANRSSIARILGVEAGTTIQLATDATMLDACYLNADSLMWRDAGALIGTICLVATALGLAAVPVGRTGGDIVHAAGLPAAYVGTGTVHVSSRTG